MEDNEKEPTYERKNRVKKYFHNLFDIRADMMSFEELKEMMEENTIIHGSNMWILMLAILIASIGLNVNSTAVIIGAMLISPLMSGILTMGYSLAVRDLSMLRKAFMRFGTQVIISLITSTVYFWISPLNVVTNEMIARTSPTIWDVLIALFGGIAGMIGNTRRKKSNVIPGVAIATALMPPLCTAGYGLATGQIQFLLGAFYLFAINTLFIALSAALVTHLLKVPIHEEISEKKQKKINRIIVIITVVTVIPSILIGGVTVYSTVLDRNIEDYLSNELVFANTQIVQSSTDKVNRVISVSLVGTQINEERISELEKKLAQYNLGGYTLHIVQNQSIEGENTDKVTIAIQENTIIELQSKLMEQQEKIEAFETAAQSQIDCKRLAEKATAIFTRLENCSCGVMSGINGDYILMSANAKEPLSPDEIQVIKNWLMTESGYAEVQLQIGVD